METLATPFHIGTAEPSPRKMLQIQGTGTQVAEQGAFFLRSMSGCGAMDSYGRTFPREISMADANAMLKQRVQGSRKHRVVTI